MYDLLIIGGGPGGSAAGFWAAKAGLKVAILEKKTFPREKTCGDGLTPRAVRQLEDMNLLDNLASFHKHVGLRARAGKKTLELPWPDHPDFPNYGLSVRRRDLDLLVAEAAQNQGAELFLGTEAVAPIFDNGLLAGAQIKTKTKAETSGFEIPEEIHARFVIVADGANSRFGRGLGNVRDRSLPQGMAIRTYFESPIHDDPWLESALDIRNPKGESLPGYGWIFPLGDGTINVGIGILSTFKNYKDINTTNLMHDWAEAVPEEWQIDPESPCIAPVGGRLPMAGAVSPKSGPNWLAVGDAAGLINPFNGEGIDYAYETGRKAAELIAEAAAGRESAIPDYEEWIQETYGLYFKMGRIFAKLIGNPVLIRELTRAGMRSQKLMGWALRIMANLLREDEKGPAEVAYRSIAKIVK